MKFFTSDPHFGHKKILEWGRPQFKTIEEHDKFLVDLYTTWAKKLTSNDEFWVLGDIFNLDYLWLMTYFNAKTVLVMGNHDAHKDIDKFKKYFDVVHEYPVYISDKICVSHVPQSVFDDQVNVYGHLHGNIIDKPNYISACLEITNYQLVSEKQVNNLFSKLPKYTRKHLEAPYTEWEKVINRPKNDLILKPNGHIDVSAMRALQKFNSLINNNPDQNNLTKEWKPGIIYL